MGINRQIVNMVFLMLKILKSGSCICIYSQHEFTFLQLKEQRTNLVTSDRQVPLASSLNTPHVTGIHTYIIGYYNPSSRIIDLVLTPLILCELILYISGGTYSLKQTRNDRFLRNFSWQFLPETYGEEIAEKILFCILL